MKSNEVRKKTDKGRRLNAEIGTRMTMSVPGAKAPVKFRLTGLEPDRYLIARLPAAKGLPAPSPEQELECRYVSWGAVYGFHTRIKGEYADEDLHLLILDYPDAIHTYEARAEQRRESFTHASISVGPKSYSGRLTDLSPRGCSFSMSIAPKSNRPDAALGKMIKLSFSLRENDDPQIFPCKVINIHEDGDSINLNLQFQFSSESRFTSELLKKFLDEQT